VNFPIFVARHYFLSGKKSTFINVISFISMAAVAFSTCMLIVVLSFFNGLGGLLRSINTSFDPELRIEHTTRKTFEISNDLLALVTETPGVEIVTEVIEDFAYVIYHDAQMPVMVRGVGANFLDQHRLNNNIIDGELALHRDSIPFAIVGSGVASTLSISVEDDMRALQIFYVRNVTGASLDPSRMYSRRAIRPGGIFSIEKNYDENYIFLPLDFTRDLFDYGNRRTFLEVKTDRGANIDRVKSALLANLGENFKVLTNEEQHEDIYRLLNLEKLFTFLTLSLLVVVGSINIFFLLMMLAIDKKKDMTILAALGATPQIIRKIFLSEGILIAVAGAVIGIVLALIICWLQQSFGLVGMGMDNAIVPAYPVEMKFTDFIYVSIVVMLVTALSAFYPAKLAARSYSTQYL
jgi:lipoprotein-releasing system permease protein